MEMYVSHNGWGPEQWNWYRQVHHGVHDLAIASVCKLVLARSTDAGRFDAYIGHFQQASSGRALNPKLSELLHRAHADFGDRLRVVLRGSANFSHFSPAARSVLLCSRASLLHLLHAQGISSQTTHVDVQWAPDDHYTQVLYDADLGCERVHHTIRRAASVDALA